MKLEEGEVNNETGGEGEVNNETGGGERGE